MSTLSVETSALSPEKPGQEAFNAQNRLGSTWLNQLRCLLGGPAQRRLGLAAQQIAPIRHWEGAYARLSDNELLKRGQQLRGRARGGESLDKILPEAFALVCVSAKRHVKLRPFDVQLAAGTVLHQKAIAEQATGEGKTLVATLPTFLNALQGKGAHVTTVNDYLARRDAEWTRPIYEALGLSVGILQQQMPDQERVKAYQCNITYGTASEFGFDFLRDRLRALGDRNSAQPFWAPWTEAGPQRQQAGGVQRGHHFALVDEADNIFIDEARTPLVISGQTREANADVQVVYQWSDKLAKSMVRNQHFHLDEKKQKIELTDEGKQLIRWSNPPYGPHSHAMDKLHEHIERSLQAHFRFRRDQHYMIEGDKVVIIDEFTGRRMPDRQWRDGLHQAVEAKEGVPIHFAADHAAQITYQSYFRLYKKRCGMSGTVVQNFWELRRVYSLWTVCVPTNKPILRTQAEDRVFPTEEAKFLAVVEDVLEKRAQGRPVLIGTRSVDRSEMLSEHLKKAGVEHQVLNARQHENEAKIVTQAGQPGRVMIATNMAGRGTDVKLGPGVAAAGGLHVIGTERHEALRIDRQLAGRAGRQGDPSSAQFFVSLEDELLEALGPDAQEHLRQVGQQGGDQNWQKYLPLFKRAQRITERRHYRQRVDLLVYEKQRQEILKDLGADPYVD